VTLIEARERLLAFADHEVVDVLMRAMAAHGIRIYLREIVRGVDTGGDSLALHLGSGEALNSLCAAVCGGTHGQYGRHGP
jgi:pyruvate/2-oxoglutarate dehydrogenase complex dihydrolipoamide dehydrogenase (E3) component